MKKLYVTLSLLLALSGTVSARNAKVVFQNQESTHQIEAVAHRATIVSDAVSVKRIISSEVLKNGADFQIVELEDGTIQKRIIKPDGRSVVRNSKISLKAEAGTATLSENFESYDGSASDWIPEGWQDICKDATPHDPAAETNLTWSVQDPTLESAYEGSYVAKVPCAWPSEPQDEWLITPSFIPAENDNLYVVIGYKPGWTLFDMNAGTFTAENNVIDVLISEDAGATWTKVWDCLAHAKTLTENELWNTMNFASLWVPLNIDLAQYVGKSVQVAFRYYGQDGESACVDLVEVRQPSLAPDFARPAGTLFSGFTTDFKAVSSTWLLGAPYVESTWANTSNIDCERFSWTFNDMITEDVDLKVNASPNMYDVPVLTASADGVEDVQQAFSDAVYVQYGSQMAAGDGAGGTVVLGAGNYKMDYGFANYGLFMTDAQWNSILGAAETTNYHMARIYNYFDQPEAPYYFTSLWIQGKVTAVEGAEFTAKVYRVVGGYLEEEPYASGVCTFADMINSTRSNGDVYTSLYFTMTAVDAETGLDVDYVEVSTPIMIELSGFDTEYVTAFDPFAQYNPNADGEANAYIGFDVSQTDESGNTTEKTGLLNLGGLRTSNGNLYVSYLFNIDATYPWLNIADDVFEAPTEGGSKIYEGDAYFYADAMTVEILDADGNEAEWVSTEFIDVADSSNAQLTVTAEALPAGLDGRSCDVVVTAPAIKRTIHVTQGTGGVSAIQVNPVSVRAIGGDFAINVPVGVNKVNIYNIAGQQVKSAELTAGANIIDASELSKGVYIFKFNNNKTVKAVK